MESTTKRSGSATKIVVISAMVLGVAAGSYGIASAATGSGWPAQRRDAAHR